MKDAACRCRLCSDSQQGENYMDIISVAYAAGEGTGAPAAAQPEGSWISMIVIIGVFLVMMYFMSIKPQQKQRKEKEQLLSVIKPGDEIMLTSGICGKVVSFKEDSDYAVIELSRGVNVTVAKVRIAHILPKGTIESLN